MSTAIPPKLMTVEQLDALPEDDIDRELIKGRLKERPMTRRNRFHAKAEANLAFHLKSWLSSQPAEQGEVLSGEVGCILRRNPDSSVGIDVAYVSAELILKQSDATTMIDGPPTLAVEILSPSDKQEDVNDKIDEYLAAGVAVVWIVDPHFKTVRVHRTAVPPRLFGVDQQISGEPQLPGFTLAVKDIFA